MGPGSRSRRPEGASRRRMSDRVLLGTGPGIEAEGRSRAGRAQFHPGRARCPGSGLGDWSGRGNKGRPAQSVGFRPLSDRDLSPTKEHR